MVVDYRELLAGFYWVKWKDRLTIGQWCKREEHWVTGLMGCWRLMPPTGLTEEVWMGLAHVWHDEQPTDVEWVGPVAAAGVAP